jgi:hypothetical protein
MIVLLVDGVQFNYKGNGLMDELRKLIFQQLRCGESIMQILYNFQKIEEELITMKDYAKAMEEAHRAP